MQRIGNHVLSISQMRIVSTLTCAHSPSSMLSSTPDTPGGSFAIQLYLCPPVVQTTYAYEPPVGIETLWSLSHVVVTIVHYGTEHVATHAVVPNSPMWQGSRHPSAKWETGWPSCVPNPCAPQYDTALSCRYRLGVSALHGRLPLLDV